MDMKNKKWILLYVVAFLLPVMLFTGLFLLEGRRFRTQANLQAAALIGNLEAHYPEVDDSAVLALLQDDGHIPEGKAFMQKYGYFGSALYGVSAGRFADAALICVLAAGLGVFVCCGAVTLFRQRAVRKETQALTEYVKQISLGGNELKIGENDEGAFSRLKNEIYKITVLLRETAAESKRHSKALSTSLSDISHQIRTPLTSAVIMLDNIADAPEMDDATRMDFLNEARKQLRRIAELCGSLLRLSRFDSGAVEMHPAPVTARQILTGAVGNLSVLLDIKSISVDFAGDLDHEFTADLYWQTEAITNILKNAAEHSPENTRINVTVENSGLFISLRIADQGEGIDEEDLPHIFDRFYKAKNAGAESFGIGLSLAKTVIEKDNGFVRVSSTPGCGTVFTVSYRLV